MYVSMTPPRFAASDCCHGKAKPAEHTHAANHAPATTAPPAADTLTNTTAPAPKATPKQKPLWQKLLQPLTSLVRWVGHFVGGLLKDVRQLLAGPKK
jgi:hypothetical protein